MKKKVTISLLIVLVAVTSFLAIKSLGKNNAKDQHQFAEITRGDLENTVSSTGTISAVGTVEIGTQVSGTLSSIYVDFNDKVKKGQLLAVLDTLLLKSTVLDAQAALVKAQAQLEKATADYNRNKLLFEKGYLSEAEFLPYKIDLKMQQASLTSAEANLQRAKRNLDYAVIRSPIDGTIIERSIEAGQTVAASLQSPTLFIIAEDLSKMQILVQVDESNIGEIKEGQKVRFNVQSYSEKTFTGTVRQIRLQPQTVQNVVMYTVVVDAANDKNLLLPGMTATVDFIVEERKDVLLVPNAALRFQPSEKMMAKARESMQKQLPPPPDSLKAPLTRTAGQAMGNGVRVEPFGNDSGTPKKMSRVWYLDETGNLAMEPIMTGTTNGSLTEIVASRNLKEGMQVISGTLQASGQAQKSSTQNRNMGGPGFGPPPPM